MSDIIVHNSPENKAQVSHIYFMAQLGLIPYFRKECITYSIYMERWFKIHPLFSAFLLPFGNKLQDKDLKRMGEDVE